MTPTHRFAYTCSGCGESLQVDGSVRDVLLEAGCVVCGGDVTPAAFAPG
jgi:hypothetical protein